MPSALSNQVIVAALGERGLLETGPRLTTAATTTSMRIREDYLRLLDSDHCAEDAAGYCQTQSPSLLSKSDFLPGTPPSSVSFQPTE